MIMTQKAIIPLDEAEMGKQNLSTKVLNLGGEVIEAASCLCKKLLATRWQEPVETQWQDNHIWIGLAN